MNANIPQQQVTVSHTVPMPLYEWIAMQARTLGISKSEVIRRALTAAKDSENQPQQSERAA